ncbi:HEAT repeat domain-containing protein [Thalassoroseus pseudoceratinae]|uniref:HEAT repeat domain-containing protein n=1 Tax=Thalassoroseus pseudoceratinae TaxID=2713176 RepID=UPI00141E0983|nr:HEAT repeat domain-containing protein [Thalassoroseus pseudoceratinae]
MSRPLILIGWMVLALGNCRGGLFASNESFYVDILTENDIRDDEVALQEFLESLHPTEQTIAHLRKLTEQLGDAEFFQREAATRELLTIPACCPEVLMEACESPDPEIRWRSRQILKQNRTRTDRILFAVFSLIKNRKLTGLAKPVATSLRLAQTDSVRRAGRQALSASATVDDADWLRELLASEHSSMAIAAVGALDRVLGPEAATDFLPLLDRPDNELRLVAARALLNHGQRDTLNTFVELLDANELTVRLQAAQTLRSATGQRFQFTPYDEPAARQQAANEWRTWVSENGANSPLNLPILEGDVELGRTLICYYGRKEVVELDERGEQTWKLEKVNGPWDCDGTPEGHRVICFYTQQAISEYNQDGEEIWSIKNIPGRPFSVQRLSNGNTLISCYNTGKIIEYRPDKSKAWEITKSGTPMDAQRLPNGHTLITLYQAQKVVEVNQEGDPVWELKDLGKPRSAHMLPNRHVLVTEATSKRVAEYDASGKMVWSHENIKNPLDAQRLSNGNTLISSSDGVIEVTPTGRTVWSKNLNGASRICRY